jgi:hypothetical protein
MEDLTIELKVGSVQRMAHNLKVVANGLRSIEEWLMNRHDYNESHSLANGRQYLESQSAKLTLLVRVLHDELLREGIRNSECRNGVNHQ